MDLKQKIILAAAAALGFAGCRTSDSSSVEVPQAAPVAPSPEPAPSPAAGAEAPSERALVEEAEEETVQEETVQPSEPEGEVLEPSAGPNDRTTADAPVRTRRAHRREPRAVLPSDDPVSPTPVIGTRRREAEAICGASCGADCSSEATEDD